MNQCKKECIDETGEQERLLLHSSFWHWFIYDEKKKKVKKEELGKQIISNEETFDNFFGSKQYNSIKTQCKLLKKFQRISYEVFQLLLLL